MTNRTRYACRMALSDQFQFVRQRYEGDIMLTTRAIGPEGFGHEKITFQRYQIFKFTKTRQHIAPPLFDPAWIFVIPSDLNEV